ncbi:AfsA-related hotdog domain-containing protein [Streptomyces sirii]|uniref:AfsA-related hotdog domain-containing protein n=1 Tax=Streptomyces sirii TaxID=3127701 RepID=UPI003D36E3F0
MPTTAPHGYGERAASSEVFLTNWRRDTADGWVVSARWPRAHGFYRSVDGAHHRLHDPLLLVETMRQAGILLSHLAHRVPFDHPITWQRIRYDLVPQGLSSAGAPAEVELHVTDHEVVRRGERLLSARQEFRVRRDGADLATATLDYACHSPSVYRRLRGRYSELTPANAGRLPLPAPVAPQLVGRDRERDVVLSPPTAPANGACGWTPLIRCSSTSPSTTPPGC